MIFTAYFQEVTRASVGISAKKKSLTTTAAGILCPFVQLKKKNQKNFTGMWDDRMIGSLPLIPDVIQLLTKW